MTSIVESIWYLEWAKNFCIVVDSECGSPAGRYISIHVGCTGYGRVFVRYTGQADVLYTMAGRAYRPLGVPFRTDRVYVCMH